MRRRRVSFRQARDCELGIGKRCRCRCRGQLHGAKRFGESPTYADFMTLSEIDPHRVPFRARESEPPLPFDASTPEAAHASR